jgi:hypothetical protein
MPREFSQVEHKLIKTALIERFSRALDAHLNKIPDEVVASAKAAEAEDLPSDDNHLEHRLLRCEDFYYDQVGAPWHPEGYDTLKNYLKFFAPKAMTRIASDAFDVNLHNLCNELLGFAATGAAEAVREAIEERDAEDEDEDDDEAEELS